MMKLILLVVAGAVLLLLTISLILGYRFSAPGYSGPTSNHFNGKKFLNATGVKQAGFRTVLKWMLQREQGPWNRVENSTAAEKPAERLHEGIRITFVNHSTFLIQADGLNLLTDPIWSERSSPISWAGPKRMKAPGLRFEDLPKIDVVLVSHNHYDHLDIPTLKRLASEHSPVIVAPLGVKQFLDEEGISGAIEADWSDQIRLSDKVTVDSVPAQHFSGRGLFDRDATLWSGYVLKTLSGNLYFAGDTGYNKEAFQEIGKRYAPLRAALLPIGAYKPIWFMSPVHISPEEAVKTHLDLNAEKSIAMHFGTFPLADDGQDEPVQDLERALTKFNLTKEQFLILREGTYYEIPRIIQKENQVTVA